MSKYLEFKKDLHCDDILVISKKYQFMLGKIKYYSAWKQHVFAPHKQTIFNDTCLQDIIKKLQECNKK